MSQAAFRPREAPPPAARVVETTTLSVEELFSNSSLWWKKLLRNTRSWPFFLRKLTRDRLDSLGETFFEEELRAKLDPRTGQRVRELVASGRRVILESQAPEHIVRPLARFLGVRTFTARRLDFRDGFATRRILPGALELDTESRADRFTRTTFLGLQDAGRVLGRLSVREAFAGKEVLLLGVSGFLGKVYLASLLAELPELGRIHVLVRRRGTRSARERFERHVARSPVLRAERLQKLLSQVHVVEGDISFPALGLDLAAAQNLRHSLDLVVNCAGLTDFNPDLRDALAVNVEGVGHVVEFVRRCEKAALLHVSTCFVAGDRDGRVGEELRPNETPSGRTDFDPEEELANLGAVVARANGNGSHLGNGHGTFTHDLKPLHPGPPEKADSSSRPSPRAAALRAHLIERGLQRARELGWPNIYTFTKALGEALIAKRGAGLPVAVVRPSIVESSIAFPFRGWNEGINTSAPLSYLLGTHFRQLPVNPRKRLDVIPVDLACRGMTLAAAALLSRRHQDVYQVASSAVNPLDLRRTVELTALAHRAHHRSQNGWRSRVLAELEAIPVSRERYGRFSAPAQLRAVRLINRVARAALLGRAPLARLERGLERAAELIALYEPFLLGNEPIFEANRIETLSAALPPEERESFAYDVRRIDWYDYWVHVHIPALRRWSFPLLEGRRTEPRRRRAAAAPRGRARSSVAVSAAVASSPTAEPSES